MNLLGNIIWFVFGGFVIFLEYLIGGLLMCLTIVGIPFGLQVLKLSHLALFPFGKQVKTNEFASGCLGILMNIIWIFLGGFWIAITHLLFAVILAITIIGIPFARQHIKLASMAITPFGKNV